MLEMISHQGQYSLSSRQDYSFYGNIFVIIVNYLTSGIRFKLYIDDQGIIVVDDPGLKTLANATLNGFFEIEEWSVLVEGYVALSQKVYEETGWFCCYFIGDVEADELYITTFNEEVTFDIVESVLSNY